MADCKCGSREYTQRTYDNSGLLGTVTFEQRTHDPSGLCRADLTEQKVREIIREELEAFHPEPKSPGYIPVVQGLLRRWDERWLA